MLWLGRLIAGFPTRWSRFGSNSDHAGFVVDNDCDGFLRILRFPCHVLLHVLLYIHESSYNRLYIHSIQVGRFRKQLKSYTRTESHVQLPVKYFMTAPSNPWAKCNKVTLHVDMVFTCCLRLVAEMTTQYFPKKEPLLQRVKGLL